MIGALLITIPLLTIAAAYHVMVLLFCHGADRDNDQETGDEHNEG